MEMKITDILHQIRRATTKHQQQGKIERARIDQVAIVKIAIIESRYDFK